MKTLIRTLLMLALIVWLGAELFFPVVAATTFGTLHGDTHTAGNIVGQLLRILHGIGFVSGMIALALLALAPAWQIYKPRSAWAPMIAILIMIACTAYSQFIIIPHMERDRIASGDAIDTTDTQNLLTQDFNRLHKLSTDVEGAVMLFGLLAVVFVARAETVRD